ncbi:hypothetical protein XENOCAPTIV_012812 [Xenoophorus captivus]|uniref:C-type lectin domain-containing protein n=1 Tax=Xenoophorus captivus TaxID=1517983 RepID=A0ABV0R8D7_9TELE
MEEIYANVDPVKPVSQILTPSNRDSSSSRKKIYLVVLISLGLLNVLLLTGLISLGVHSRDLGSLAAGLSNIKDNLTDRLQASNDQLSFMTEQRDLLKANLTEMSKELIRLQSLSKQKKTCSAGWSMFGCSCYYLSTRSGSWDEGREDCRNKGSDLLVIDSADEQKYVSALTEKFVWIGLNDKDTEGSWKWVDGSSPNFTYWSKAQPDNGGGDPRWGEEDCAYILSSDQRRWNDRSCSASMQWICEKVPTKV